MREKTTLFVTTIMLIPLMLFSCQIQPVKAEPATITGTVLYNGQPISDFTNKPANFWARNEITYEALPISPTYDTSTGEYSIPNVPPGTYGISVFIDDALPFNTETGYAGDFDGFNSPIVVPEGQPVVNKDLDVYRVLHLTSPVDNAAIIGPWPSIVAMDMYPTGEITFTWDALAEASSYEATIYEFETPFQYVKMVTDILTSNTEWKVVLPMSEENHFYLFSLYAYNINELPVGWLEVAYSVGYGWDYPFRVGPTPSDAIDKTEYIKSIVADASWIPISDFDGATDKVKDKRRNALLNKLDAVITDIEAAMASTDPAIQKAAYQSAIDQLNSILDKTDGCPERGTPDTISSGYTPDWITTCASQRKIYQLIRNLITMVQALLAQIP